MNAKAVSHAERLRRRHERMVAAGAVPPPARGPDAAERSEEGSDASQADELGPNPFAAFMGCAP